jgi:hypothetical protein
MSEGGICKKLLQIRTSNSVLRVSSTELSWLRANVKFEFRLSLPRNLVLT